MKKVEESFSSSDEERDDRIAEMMNKMKEERIKGLQKQNLKVMKKNM